MVVQKVIVSLVESTGVCQTPPDSGGLPTKRSPVDWSTGLDSTRLHQTPPVVLESPVFCGFLAIFGTIEAGAIKKKLCHKSRCLKHVIFPVWTGLNWKNYLF